MYYNIKFNQDSEHRHYKKLELKEGFYLTWLPKIKFWKFYKVIDTLKAGGTDKLLGIFLNDGANILVNPIIKLSNISIIF